jgi:hypothetical protein
MAALDKAKAAHAVGDNLTALEAIWAAQEAIWNLSPLGIRNAAFVSEQPENFGTYKPKVGENFSPSEPLIFYCEPFGYTQKTDEYGAYHYSIIGAFSILDASGKVLGGQDNLGPYEQGGYHTFSTECMMAMTIGIQGLIPGNYTLRLTLTDNLDQTKSVQIDKPFNLVAVE